MGRSGYAGVPQDEEDLGAGGAGVYDYFRAPRRGAGQAPGSPRI
jgi:hypothetical protein